MKNIAEITGKRFADLPEKVLQIGEGNFLRAFVEVAVEKANSTGDFGGRVIICQPLSNSRQESFCRQNCTYTIITRGVENGKTVNKSDMISSVSRYISIKTEYDKFLECAENPDLTVIVSNTTEAGIVFCPDDKACDAPPSSFPAKLTVFLYKRYKFFIGDKSKGLLILPCELIEHNGDELRKAVFEYATQWDFETGFVDWLTQYCCFASTLVDRIVTGYPVNEADRLFDNLGYEDKLLDVCEPYMFWAIEAEKKWESHFPVDKTGLNIIFTDNIEPYRTRKVRILNGAHTMSVLAAFLDGKNTVLEMMSDKSYSDFIHQGLFNEIIPTINLPENELEDFAQAVTERFMNPFIKHRLLDISLNSVSKFKARNLCTMLEYYDRFGVVPDCLSFSLAALIKFYDCKEENDGFYGVRNGEKYLVRDNFEVLRFMSRAHCDEITVVNTVLSNRDFWGLDLNTVSGLCDKVNAYYRSIEENGITETLNAITG